VPGVLLEVLSVDLKVRQAQTLSAAPGVGTRLTLSTTSSSGDVRLTLAVTTDFYVFPQSSSEFPSGPGEENLLTNITELFTTGASCAADSSCNGTFVSLQTSP